MSRSYIIITLHFITLGPFFLLLLLALLSLAKLKPLPKLPSTVLDPDTFVSSSSRPSSLDLPQLTQPPQLRFFYTSSAFWCKKIKLSINDTALAFYRVVPAMPIFLSLSLLVTLIHCTACTSHYFILFST
jgi:hypothetical protein